MLSKIRRPTNKEIIEQMIEMIRYTITSVDGPKRKAFRNAMKSPKPIRTDEVSLLDEKKNGNTKKTPSPLVLFNNSMKAPVITKTIPIIISKGTGSLL